MSALKQLSAVYMVAASAFAVAILFAHHPGLARSARTAAEDTGRTGMALAARLEHDVLHPAYGFVKERSARAWLALAAIHPVSPAPSAKPAPKAAPAAPVLPGRVIVKTPPARPRLATIAPPATEPHPVVPASRAPLSIAPPPAEVASLPPADHPPGTAELVRVEQRLKDNLSQTMLANFALFVYVSKADKGPWAQRMYVFAKDASGDLVLRHDWPVSTGREQTDINPNGVRMTTGTPVGYYELDPDRMYRHYTSHQWRQPMPYAMFFNWVHDGLETGLAIHAAHGTDISLLGRRASAGCIHLAPQNAATLFDLIRTKYKGPVPQFAFNRRTGTMSSDGLFLHDAHGKLRYAEGYKVLVFIENYGGENVVAMLM